MGISVVNYRVSEGSGSSWGVLRGDLIYPLSQSFSDHKELMACYFSEREKFNGLISGASVESKDMQFNSPVSQNVQLFLQGLNYADHRAESGASQDHGENLLFLKAPSSICGPNETILRPKGCQLLDYEIELALVMKESIAGPVEVEHSDLSKYVGGLVLCNDVSARDFMFGSPMLQWYRGKSQRTFCPMGPVLYLMDEEDFRQFFSLQLTLKLNGVTKQFASTDQLIHRPAETLTEISSFANLEAGDCILTGTPGGVLVNADFKTGLAIILNLQNDKKRRDKFTRAQLAQTRFLEPGDVLELSIKTPDGAIDLGTQRNEIADAR